MRISKNISPLRYPGGKACLTGFISELAIRNELHGGTYFELYAGGAGAALNLLYNDIFDQIHINDYDYHIFAMWDAILNHTDEFISKIERVEVTVSEWNNQKEIYNCGTEADVVSAGFSTFFLNRTNRSGIIFKAGPIGGFEQNGNYKIDVRFNKSELIGRIRKIESYKHRIKLTQLDAIEILTNVKTFCSSFENCFFYLDPPYYKKGKLLYLNNYTHENHVRLASVLSDLEDIKWLVSYDNVDQIKSMYDSFRMSSFDLNYTLHSKKFGSELLVFSNNLKIGKSIIVNKRRSELTLL